ncbi:hypothetical protein [Algoriphagus sp. CAU 1675]|uniref:hypothetical protein n=1 Tax=Algoriphagus sp. CAU 1675 TaxID=3032597 RepID=UPI0023DB3E9F|nr:hypothetical protein [Algoriphagus sp. CAU 1675]MDF2157788.1 hypothetical protein [Algoriphagus sp. CAU 1675]
MKRLAILIFLISTFCSGIIYQTMAQEMTKQDYLELSRQQKNVGLILLGGGAALVTTGLLIVSGDLDSTIGGVCFYTGSIAVVSGLVTLIHANNTKMKANKLTLSNHPLYILGATNGIQKSYPALTFKISLN